MADIEVQKKSRETFLVTVKAGRTTTHTVTVADDYYEKLVAGNASREALLRASFEFLLERESNTMILSRFDLPVIGHYFPEYECDIIGRLGT